MNCDDFQLDLEKRALHALAGEQLARLEQHLSGCVVCQAYAAGLRRFRAAGEQASEPDWARIESLLRRRMAATQRRVVVMVGAQAALVVAGVWLVGLPAGGTWGLEAALLAVLAGSVLFSAALALSATTVIAHRMGRLTRVEMLPWLRRQSRRSVALVRVGRWPAGLIGLAGLVFALAPLGGFDRVQRAVGLLSAFLLVEVLLLHLRVLPRARAQVRQLEELER